MGKREHLIKGLKDFLKKLNEKFSIEKTFLFGSRATNNFNEDSDVDLVIVSSNFEKVNFFERVKSMYDYWNLRLPVDFLCYTPKEFNKLKNQVSIVREAVENGIEIK